MRKYCKNLSNSLVLTRNFESSRLQGANLITAFERALPIVRRSLGRAPRPCTKPELAPLQRRAGS
jgi:hypothetical protein